MALLPEHCVSTDKVPFDSSQSVDHTHAMSKRLQVILDDAELREIQRIARRQRLTVAEWVRQALRVDETCISSERL